MKKKLHLLVSGLVQGVGFRYFVLRCAQRYSLTGWVKNLPDSRVEVMASGDEKALIELLGLIKQGPDFSAVEDIIVEWQSYENLFDDFKIVY